MTMRCGTVYSGRRALTLGRNVCLVLAWPNFRPRRWKTLHTWIRPLPIHTVIPSFYVRDTVEVSSPLHKLQINNIFSKFKKFGSWIWVLCFQIQVFWFMSPFSLIGGYQRFQKSATFHLLLWRCRQLVTFKLQQIFVRRIYRICMI
jgi:hypothetical protein